MGFYVSRDDYSTRKKLESCSDAVMIGRLAVDEDSRPKVDVLDSQFHNYFIVEPLCDEPIPINNLYSDDENDYIGIDNQLDYSQLPTEYDSPISNTKRLSMLEETFYDKLIIFRPAMKINRSSPDYMHKNISLIDTVEFSQDDRPYFYPVPKVAMDVNAFKERLKEGAYINLSEYSSELRKAPEFIVCGDNVFYMAGQMLKNPNQPLMWSCKDASRVKQFEVKINRSISPLKLLEATDNIFFLNQDFATELQSTQNIFGQKPEEKVVFKKPEPVKETTNVKEATQTLEEPANHLSTEIDFLNAFKQLTINADLIYKKEDLINLHTCIKSNTLTIVAGMSGTGKTQLALNYAKMLDLDEQNKTLLFLPISPSFTEPEDVLGYYSNSNQKYIPASTGLVDFLHHAENDLNHLHMVIFDEMNLSQIEYWFSPFISILERDVDDRYLTLYNDQEEAKNKELYPPRIKINENVIFVGTVNLDETTKDLSDRLLDRSFVIALEKQRFAQFTTDLDDKNKGKTDLIESNKCRNTQTFDLWRAKSNNKQSLTPNELQFFDEAHDSISRFDSQKGISFRIIRNINSYLNNVPTGSEDKTLAPIINRQDALDLLFKQTVLNKLKGSDTALEELLGRLDDNGNYLSGKLVEVFDRYQHISHFDGSRKEIERKVSEFAQYGYTR